MRRSFLLQSPVLSFFSSSPAASRRAQEALQTLFSLEPLSFKPEEDNELDQTLCTPGFRRRWDSVASKCPTSGAIVHLLSLTTSSAIVPSRDDDGGPSGSLSLLSLTGSIGVTQSDGDHVATSRRVIAAHMKKKQRHRFFRMIELSLLHASNRPIGANDILAWKNGLPLLQFSVNERTAESISEISTSPSSGLKEVALPHYDEAVYDDGTTLQSTLSRLPHLKRPALGLYQWPSHNGVAFRPIPSARQDQSIPAPSLVFRCDDLDHAAERLAATSGVRTAKIGYSGLNSNKNGQLMVLHKDLVGLDVRMTDNLKYSCGFAEAQQALMAASLDELQSANVLVEGGHGEASQRVRSDPMNGLGDCWMEFRANLKHPSGFFKGRNDTKRKMRIARPPDLPYE